MIIQTTQLENQKFRNYQELMGFVLGIAKESLEEILQEDSFQKYRELLQCYQSSPQELRDKVKEVQTRISQIRGLLKQPSPKNEAQAYLILRGFSPRWIQIFANILFIIEPEIINLNGEVVRKTWEAFFRVMPSEFNPLNIRI